MALELDTDLIKEDVNLSDILITIDKLKSQVSQIPEYGFDSLLYLVSYTIISASDLYSVT